MKIRESGMPEESVWNKFFDVDNILTELEIDSEINNIVEIGCGYGTFSVPVSRRIKGSLYTFDIENEMLEVLQNNPDYEHIENVIPEKRDVITDTTGLPDNSADYFMLFNILHNKDPHILLDEAYRILKQGGKIGIIHWRSDIETPRGPDLSIRPLPEQIIDLIDEDKFSILKQPFFLGQYHYGFLISKL